MMFMHATKGTDAAEASFVEHRRSRRRDVRVATSLEVLVTWSATTYAGRCTSLSLGGMFVETDLRLDYESFVEVELIAPGVVPILRLQGVVRWSNMHGFGLQLLPVGVATTRELLTLVDRARRTAGSCV